MTASDFFWRDGEQLLTSLIQILPGITAKTDTVNQAFRYVHSIRSQAEYLRVTELSDASSDLEDRLGQLRQGGHAPTSEELNELYRKSLDLQQIFLQIKQSASAPRDLTSLPMEADVQNGRVSDPLISEDVSRDLFGHMIDTADRNALRHAVRAAERNGEDMFWLHLKLCEQADFRKHRKYLILHTVEQNMHVCLHTDVEDSDSDDFAAVFSGKQDEDAVRRLLRSSGISAIQLQRLDSQQFLKRIGEIPGVEPGLLAQAGRVQLSLSSRAYEEFLLGLHLVRGRMDERSRAISQELLGLLSASGMVPVADVVLELVPLVEQLADQQKKLVNCRLLRSEEKVPATVASVLREAMVHLLRNAVDHGIELPQERLKKDKKAAGTLKIELGTDGDWLDILLQDDGRGIHIPDMPDDAGELLDLLCKPGFSSAQADLLGTEVEGKSRSRISGRGVGLDAVRHSIENLLHGKIELLTSSDIGEEGTGFLLRIPRNPAVLSVLIVRDIKDGLWALPGLCVYDRFRIMPETVNKSADASLYYQYEDRMLPLYNPDASRVSVLPESSHFQAVRLIHNAREYLMLIAEAIAEEGVVLSTERIFSEILQQHVLLWDPWEFSDL